MSEQPLSVAVIGCGGVGLSAVNGAAIAGASGATLVVERSSLALPRQSVMRPEYCGRR